MNDSLSEEEGQEIDEENTFQNVESEIFIRLIKS